LTAEIRDLQLCFSALEGRFAAMESRFSAMEIRLGAIERRLDVQEERMSAMLAVIVRIAERIDRTTEPSSG
jgi:predicted  nucleic acid-binding Zn-ribbon protein